MEYKRLTKYNEYSHNAEVYAYSVDKDVYFDGIDIVYNENSSLAQEIIDRLAELEDKIENGILIELPCIRKINSPLGAYEAVYINERDLVQECIVSTDKEGWIIVEKYGYPKHSKIAEQRLKELEEKYDFKM